MPVAETCAGPHEVGVLAGLITLQLAEAVRRYPIRKVTTPVPVEGGPDRTRLERRGGWRAADERRHLVPWRREPNGSACQRRTMAGVQDEAKHAISAMSPLKSCEVEKPQPQR